jgi:toxin HigB-1
MIENIQHKGLKLLYEDNDPRKLNPEHVGQLKLILFALDNARTLQEIDQETFRLHRLKGNR